MNMILNLYFKLLFFTFINNLYAHNTRYIDDDSEDNINPYSIEILNDVPRSRPNHQRSDLDKENTSSDVDLKETEDEIRKSVLRNIMTMRVSGGNPENVEVSPSITRGIRRRYRGKSRYPSSNFYKSYIKRDWDRWANQRNAHTLNGAIDANAEWKTLILNPNYIKLNKNGIHTLLKPKDEESISNYRWKPIKVHASPDINPDKIDLKPFVELEREATGKNNAWKPTLVDSSALNSDNDKVVKILEVDNEENTANYEWNPWIIDTQDVDSDKVDVNSLLEPDEETVSNNRWKIIKIEDSNKINSDKIDISQLLDPENKKMGKVHRWKPIRVYSHASKNDLLGPENKDTAVWKPVSKDSNNFVSNDELINDDIKTIKFAIEHNWVNLDEEDTFNSFKTYWLKLLTMLKNLKGRNEKYQRNYLLALLESMKKSMMNNPEYFKLYLKSSRKKITELQLQTISNSQTTNLTHKTEQTPVSELVITMPPNNELIRKICEGVNQNVEDFWEIFYSYFGQNPKGTKNLQELEKLYLILTIFTKFNEARRLGMPIENYVDKIIKIISPDIQFLAPTILNVHDKSDAVDPNTTCVNCNVNRINDIINNFINNDKETKRPRSEIAEYKTTYVLNIPYKWKLMYTKNRNVKELMHTIDTSHIMAHTIKPTSGSNSIETETFKPLPNPKDKTTKARIKLLNNDWVNKIKYLMKLQPVKSTIHDVEANIRKPLSVLDWNDKNVNPIVDSDNFKAKILQPMLDLDLLQDNTKKSTTNIDAINTETIKPMSELDTLEESTMNPMTNMDDLIDETVNPVSNTDDLIAEPVNPVSNMDDPNDETVKPIAYSNILEDNTLNPMSNIHDLQAETVNLKPDLDTLEVITVNPMTNIHDLKAEIANPITNMDDSNTETINSKPDFYTLEVNTLSPEINIHNLKYETEDPEYVIYPLPNSEKSAKKIVQPKPDLNSLKAETIKSMPEFGDLKMTSVKPILDIDDFEIETVYPTRDLDFQVITMKPITDIDDQKVKTVYPLPKSDNIETVGLIIDTDAKTVKPMTDVKDKTRDPMRDLEDKTAKPLRNEDAKTVKPIGKTNKETLNHITDIESKTMQPMTDLEENIVMPIPYLNNLETITLRPQPNRVPAYLTENSLNLIPEHFANELDLEVAKTYRPGIINASLYALKDPEKIKKYYSDRSDDDIITIIDHVTKTPTYIKILNTGDKYTPFSGKTVNELIAKNPTLAKILGIKIIPPTVQDTEYVVQPDFDNWSSLPEIESQIHSMDIPIDKNNDQEKVPDKYYQYKLKKKPGVHTKYYNYDPYMSVDAHQEPNVTQSELVDPTEPVIASVDLVSRDSLELISRIIVVFLRNQITKLGLDVLIRNLDFSMIIRHLAKILLMLVNILTTNGISPRIIMKLIMDIKIKLRMFHSPQMRKCVQKVYALLFDIIASVLNTIKENLTK